MKNAGGGLKMKEYIEDRVLEIAQYIIDNNATVRGAASVFNVSKSTVHKDVHERLGRINRDMYRKCSNVLEKNKAERHIRGGLATREKYRLEHMAHTEKSMTNHTEF